MLRKHRNNCSEINKITAQRTAKYPLIEQPYTRSDNSKAAAQRTAKQLNREQQQMRAHKTAKIHAHRAAKNAVTVQQKYVLGEQKNTAQRTAKYPLREQHNIAQRTAKYPREQHNIAQ